MFKGFSHSAQGTSHIEKKLPCQDSVAHYESDTLGIAVVSDGHGSEKHFRSATGSKIATDISIQAIKEFITKEDEYIDAIFSSTDKILNQLESNIIYRWTEEVHRHFNENPLTEEEKVLHGDVNLERVTRTYGATLIAAVMTEKYWFALQIG
ncbi:MAG: protein phosphatase 2C domain-containing protein, partial [Nitrososphaerota archaeon]|nr:protein phosphatase 2C domain-containing protein [Nitrososphaerota archaeon]